MAKAKRGRIVRQRRRNPNPSITNPRANTSRNQPATLGMENPGVWTPPPIDTQSVTQGINNAFTIGGNVARDIALDLGLLEPVRGSTAHSRHLRQSRAARVQPVSAIEAVNTLNAVSALRGYYDTLKRMAAGSLAEVGGRRKELTHKLTSGQYGALASQAIDAALVGWLVHYGTKAVGEVSEALGQGLKREQSTVIRYSDDEEEE